VYINILPLNKNNEPFDINYVNIKEEVFFTYEDVSASTAPLILDGSEKWVWNFDEGYIGISDTKNYEVIGFNEPVSAIFYRSGARTVSVSVFEDSGTSWDLKYYDSINFNVFDFPTEIIGPDFAGYNSDVNFTIDAIFQPQEFIWKVNGKLAGSNSESLTIEDFKVRSLIECTIINGVKSVKLKKICIVSVPNSVFGKKYESDVTSSLMFFNKEGDNLNFELVNNEGINRWEGDMIFHPNSSDTFKTVGLYILEKVDPIKITSEDLLLEKMQIFNQYGVDFEKKWSDDILITGIKPVNTDSNFYTKWIEGNDIHLKIPLGAEIFFEDIYSVEFGSNGIYVSHQSIPDFESFSSSGLKTYTVVGNRADAIMVITDTPNSTYSSLYGTGGILGQDYNYGSFRNYLNAIQTIPQGIVKCLSLIKIFDTQEYDPEWNEQEYKSLLYDKKKITIVNSQKNDGVYTVNYVNDDTSNDIKSKYVKIDCVDINDLIPDTQYGFKVDVKFKTNRVLISSTPVDFLPHSSDNAFLNDRDVLVWEKLSNKDYTPNLLKPELGFYFENLIAEDNLDFQYKCIRVDEAKNILTPQTDDESGYRIELVNLNNIKSITFTIVINLVTTYSLKEGVEWNRGTTLEEAAFNLAKAIRDNVTGLAVISVDKEVWVWEKNGYVFGLSTAIDSQKFKLHTGILSDNKPKYGVVGDEWVLLNNSLFNGYIHHKKTQGNFHVVYFTGIYPNEVANWYVLPDDKKVVWVDAYNELNPTESIKFKENIIADCYLNDTVVSFIQTGDASVTADVLISRFITKFTQGLSGYGIDLYQDLTEICLARNYLVESLASDDDYIDVTFFKDNTIAVNEFLATAATNGTAGTNVPPAYEVVPPLSEYKTVDLLNTVENLITEYNHIYGKYNKPKSISELWERKIIIKDIDNEFGFVMKINGIDYPVVFDNVVTILPSIEDNIVDIEETLFDWGTSKFTLEQDKTPIDNTEVGRRYFEVLESLGILVWLEKSVESYVQGNLKYDTLVLQSKFPNVHIDYEVNGTLNNHKILHSDIEFKEIGTILTITINRQPYSITYQGSIPSTIAAWKDEWEASLIEQEIIVDHLQDSTSGTSFIDLNNNILRFSTLREKSNFKYTVWVGKNPTPSDELYTITNWRTGNTGIVIAGNEINLVSGADFQEIGFGTGMITSINGSIYPLNNQEYNILLVEPITLGLSYQGPFWDNTDTNSYIETRSGFNWNNYDESSSGIGVNLILNPTFGSNSTAWWVYNDVYQVYDEKVEFYENLGISTPIFAASHGKYNFKYTTYDNGTSGYFGTSGFYVPAVVSIYQVTGPNTFVLLYQNIQTGFGTSDVNIDIPSSNIKIVFASGLSNGYVSMDNIEFTRLLDVPVVSTVTLSTREFLRYPRERFDGEQPIQFKMSWLEDDESIFFYDFSGDQLKNSDEGVYQYIGPTPLIDENNNVFLNDKPNRDISKIKDLKYQQTIFDELIHNLKLIDSEEDLNPHPTPLQVFMGYKCLDEGVNKRTLLIHRLENISLTITTRKETNFLMQEVWKDVCNFDDTRQEIYVNDSTINFIQAGFKVGQRVRITGKDITSKNNQAVFKNSGFEGEITLVNASLMRFKPINKDIKTESTLTTTSNIIPPFKTKVVAMEINIEVIPQEIARLVLRGQTEIEDERFKVLLNNFGYNINHRDVYIFKEYDIKENGIDWTFLNEKRKEMLLVYPEIYNYLGSYKALVNAINYFGYNDLELYEYYKNIDIKSKHYNKLHKIEIPDIFDNKVSGWTANDYIIQSLPNSKYEKTRMFNLTYRITDKEGNIILAYSLDEVITKLLGLKKWLREKIMPIGTRIKDLTGRGETTHTTELWHDIKHSRKFNIKEQLTPVDFKIEGYLQPVENNSRTYNIHLEFFTNSEDYKPDFYTVKIMTFAAKPDFKDPNFKLKSVRIINHLKTDMKAINFSADRIMDPYILVEVSCDNGYGANYTVKRTYSLEILAFI
jgi:hypothetical protein